MGIDVLLLFLGLIGLYLGAEALIRGGAGLTLSLGIKPILIGLTVVAFGTSLPELTVGVISSAQGIAGLSIGNVVGSNICNILLIFGVMALIRPIVIEEDNLRKDIPAVLASAALLWILAADGAINRLDGALLLLGFCVYIKLLWDGRKSRFAAHKSESPKSRRLLFYILIPVGLGLLIFGGWACVKGGSGIARYFAIPEYIIGLTIIAIGTSLPELAIGVLASSRGESELPVGNALGSNIFNSLGVVGVSAMIRPFSINADMTSFSLPAMLAASMAFLPIVTSGKRLTRLEGLGFLIAYGVYICALF